MFYNETYQPQDSIRYDQVTENLLRVYGYWCQVNKIQVLYVYFTNQIKGRLQTLTKHSAFKSHAILCGCEQLQKTFNVNNLGTRVTWF